MYRAVMQARRGVNTEKNEREQRVYDRQFIYFSLGYERRGWDGKKWRDNNF